MSNLTRLEAVSSALDTAISTAESLPEADVQLPELTNPATAADIVSGKEAIDENGEVITGTIATVTQATPDIYVSSTGLITAIATQNPGGYVPSGTKSSSKQLTTQGAKTITPSTSSQTAVASDVYTTGAITVAAIPSTYVKPKSTKSATTYTPTTSNQTIAAGTYCSGAQTIKGDSNLVAGNIKSGVSIFGVAGTYEGNGSSGDTNIETCTVTLTYPASYNLVINVVINGEIACSTMYAPLSFSNKQFNNVLKGSFLVCGQSTLNDAATSVSISGSVEHISTNKAHTCGHVFKINGDCTITISK